MEEFVHLALIWSSVLIASYFAEKTRLTAVLWFLAFGAILVNLGWLPRQSSEFIRVFSEIGIVVIMFALGFEESTDNFISSIKKSWGIALFGAIAPFTTAYYSALAFWGEHNIAVMCGLAMTATAVSLTLVSLRSEGLHTSKAATGIMTSAVLDDIASLVLVAVLVPIATGQGSASVTDLGLVVLKAAVFFIIITVIGLWIFPHEIKKGWMKHIPFLSYFGVRDMIKISKGEKATLVLLLIAVVISLLAHKFGFHPAVGAYMAGLIFKREYFFIDVNPRVDYYRRTKRIIDDVAFSWIGPVFFVELGTKLVFDHNIFLSVLDETLILTVGLFFAQILSAGLAARYTGRFSWGDSVMIGFGMLGRAELAFVVMDIAYVENSILSTEAFYTLMFTAFFLNITVPLTIRMWKPIYSGEKRLFGRNLASHG